MPLDIDRLTPQHSIEPHAFDPHGETAKQHTSHRHLVDDGIEPFDKEKLEVWGFAFHLDPNLWLDFGKRYNCS
jgi:hypothetical protein